jgi:UDP-N-acetylglucosamine 4,6-dehydratase
MAEIGSICSYMDKCIHSGFDGCTGIDHQNCPTKKSIISGNYDKEILKKVKSGFIKSGIEGKAILITGGSGSFGTAFCEYVKENNLKPRKLVVFSRDYMKQQTLKNRLGELDYMVYLTGDVRDKERLEKAFRGIDIIIHAAADKFIEHCEEDPDETLKTNVMGTRNVVEAALYRKVNKTILISTDKAVESITTYGTTKAMAEAIVIGGNKYKSSDDVRFSVCRYGNVIGSAGSVVPIFKKLIAEGATKLPLTDERMSRYWLPINKAVEFVLDSIEKMQGGEIFKPKMPSIWLKDLCAAFDMPYEIVGLRCLEKLHEKIDENNGSNTNDWFLTVDEIRQSIKNMI